MNNKKLVKNLNLSADEQIRLMVRRYLLTYWWQLLLVLFFLLLPFFLLYPLFQWEMWGPAVFVIILSIGLLGLLRLYITWYFNCLIVTNQRIIDFDQRGPLDRTVSEAPLERIDDVSYRRKGFLQSIFNYGTVQYSIPPGRAKIMVRGVKNPQAVCKKIISLIEEVRPREQDNFLAAIDSVQGLKAALGKIKEELGDDHFNKIVSELKRNEEPAKKPGYDHDGPAVADFWEDKDEDAAG